MSQLVLKEMMLTTEAYINAVNDELSVLYEDINQEKLIDVLHYEQKQNIHCQT